jgi:NTE family protein
MVRNLPVDIARELCADVVIAVWMTTPPPVAEDLDSALALVSRSMDVMIGANQNEQIESLGPDDIGIEVPMGDIGTGDFQRIAEAVTLGGAAAEALPPPALFRSPSRITCLASRSLERRNPHIWPRSVSVGPQQVSPSTRVAPENLKPEPTSTAGKSKRTRTACTRRRLRADRASLKGPADARVLTITPVEKSWGPISRGDVGHLGRAYARWIGDLDARWNNAVQIGRRACWRRTLPAAGCGQLVRPPAVR